MTLVSVIVPCYNVAEFITECVDSIFNQTYKNLEVICVDNNSVDQTWTVLMELKKKYPDLILEKELKPGGNAARNKGLSIAKGKWIQFLDADDLLMPTKIEHQLKLMETSEVDFDFIAGAFVKREITGVENNVINFENDQFVAPFINKCGTTCSNLWKREALSQIGNWDEKIFSSQEGDLMLRLIANNKKFLTDKVPLTIVRARASGQISQKKPEEKLRQYIVIRLNYINKLKESKPAEYDKRKIFFYNFILISVILLARTDKNLACDYFNKYIKGNVGLNFKSKTFNWKILFIKLFGFKLFVRMFV